MVLESGSTSHLVGFPTTFPATFPAPSQPPYESVRTDSSSSEWHSTGCRRTVCRRRKRKSCRYLYVKIWFKLVLMVLEEPSACELAISCPDRTGERGHFELPRPG